MQLAQFSFGLLLGELVAEQSSGRSLAVPAATVEAGLDAGRWVMAIEVQGAYSTSEFDGGVGRIASGLSVGVRVEAGQAGAEFSLGPGVRWQTAAFGDYKAQSTDFAIRGRALATWQIHPRVALRGGVGAWLAPEFADIDAMAGAAWCF